MPDWNKEEVEQVRETVNTVAATATDASKLFGKQEGLDPVSWMLGAAMPFGNRRSPTDNRQSARQGGYKLPTPEYLS